MVILMLETYQASHSGHPRIPIVRKKNSLFWLKRFRLWMWGASKSKLLTNLLRSRDTHVFWWDQSPLLRRFL